MLNNVLTGKHEIELKLEGYNKFNTTVIVEEGQDAIIEAKMSDVFQAIINSEPQSANVKINGVYKGVTPLQLDLSIGDYFLEISKPDYSSYRKTVHFSETQSNYNVQLKKSYFKSTNFYFGASFWPNGMTPIANNGIHFHAGAYLKNFNVELDFYPWKSHSDSFDGYWAINSADTDGSGNKAGAESMQFSYIIDKPIITCKFGYGIVLFRKLRITPQVGYMFSNIVSTVDDSYKVFGGNSTKKSFVNSIQGDVRLEYTPLLHLSLFYTPGYNQVVNMGSIASTINVDDVIINRYNGFYNNIGVSIYF